MIYFIGIILTLIWVELRILNNNIIEIYKKLKENK